MTALELSRASARTDALFRAHRDEVYRTLLRDLGSPADAEDGTQAVFLSAFRSLERGCAPWSARAWLLAIARNVARRTWRERARAAEGFEPDDVPAAEAPDDARRELFDAIEELPLSQRQALLLHELCGMRYDEISQVTEQSVAGVETSVFRARRAVRSALLNDGALDHEGATRLLDRFVAGKLTRQERKALQAHLVRCEECAALEAALRAPRLRRRTLGWLVSIPSVVQRLAATLQSSPSRGLGAAGLCVVALAGAASDGPRHEAAAPQQAIQPATVMASAGREPAAPASVSAKPTHAARAWTTAPEPRRTHAGQRQRSRPGTTGTTRTRESAPPMPPASVATPTPTPPSAAPGRVIGTGGATPAADSARPDGIPLRGTLPRTGARAVGGLVIGVAQTVDAAVTTVRRSVDTAVTDVETAVEPIDQGSLGAAHAVPSGPVTSDAAATVGDIASGDASLPGTPALPGLTPP
jgi:RNA polymerase sigma-70 factor (ECF subfamily)